MLSSLQPAPLERAAHIPHELHTGTRLWSAANPVVSLWVELLNAWGFEPFAVLCAALSLDFTGDQFPALTLPPDDLRHLYGVTTFRMTVYDRLETHIATQTSMGNVVLVDVDSFYLPDLPNSYGARHGAARVAIDRLDPHACTASYYRQGKRFELTGDDYRGIFHRLTLNDGFDEALVQHVECAKRTALPISAEALPFASLQRLRQHVASLPAANPIAAFQRAFHESLDTLSASDEAYRHAFVFGTLSQLGSRFELLAAYLSWLDQNQQPQSRLAIQACRRIASESLVCQLRLLRATSRGHIDACEDALSRMECDYDVLHTKLSNC